MIDHHAPCTDLPTRLPADARLTRWRAPDGWEHRRFDLPGDGRGRLLFQGGRADVVEKYLVAVEHFRSAGWAVSSFDWRGQGGSGRLGATGVGHADDFGVFVADLQAFWEEWRREGEGPHVLVTHSMGAHVALRAMAAKLVRPDAVVLSAPMVRIRSPLGQRLGGAIAESMCRRGPAARAAWKVSEYPAAVERRMRRLTKDNSGGQDSRWWQADGALKLGPPSWGWVAEAFRSGAALERDARVAAIDVPTLFLVPEHDRLVDARAALALAARMPTAEVMRFGPEAGHEVLRESLAVRARAFAAVDRFLDRTAPMETGP